MCSQIFFASSGLLRPEKTRSESTTAEVSVATKAELRAKAVKGEEATPWDSTDMGQTTQILNNHLANAWGPMCDCAGIRAVFPINENGWMTVSGPI